jgi:hypothetical protein
MGNISSLRSGAAAAVRKKILWKCIARVDPLLTLV